jgi:hypothetical protein
MNGEENQAVRSRKRHRKAGDMAALKRRLWRALCEAEDILDEPERTPELRLKCVQAMATAAGYYRQLLETSDLEQQLAAIEARLARGEGR